MSPFLITLPSDIGASARSSGRPGIDEAAARPAGLATVDAGGREENVVLAESHDGLVGEQLDLAHDPAAAPVEPGSAGVLVERVLPEPHAERPSP